MFVYLRKILNLQKHPALFSSSRIFTQEKRLCSTNLQTEKYNMSLTIQNWREGYVSSKHELLASSEGARTLHDSLTRGYMGLHFQPVTGCQAP